MWKSSIRGIILSQIQFSFADEQGSNADSIYCEVLDTMDDLAWFHRIPVLFLAATTTILCFVRYGKRLDKLDQVRRQRFIEKLSKLPLWGLFHKLISSITLLHYFDHRVASRKA